MTGATVRDLHQMGHIGLAGALTRLQDTYGLEEAVRVGQRWIDVLDELGLVATPTQKDDLQFLTAAVRAYMNGRRAVGRPDRLLV